MCALAAHRQATAAWLHGDILTAGDTQHFLLDGLPLSRSEFQQVIFLRMRRCYLLLGLRGYLDIWLDPVPALVFVICASWPRFQHDVACKRTRPVGFYCSNRVTLPSRDSSVRCFF